jgi:hypothetical protein
MAKDLVPQCTTHTILLPHLVIPINHHHRPPPTHSNLPTINQIHPIITEEVEIIIQTTEATITEEASIIAEEATIKMSKIIEVGEDSEGMDSKIIKEVAALIIRKGLTINSNKLLAMNSSNQCILRILTITGLS